MYQGTSSPRSTFILPTSRAVRLVELAFSTGDSVVRPLAVAAVSAPEATMCPAADAALAVSMAVSGKKLSSQQPPWSVPNQNSRGRAAAAAFADRGNSDGKKGIASVNPPAPRK